MIQSGLAVDRERLPVISKSSISRSKRYKNIYLFIFMCIYISSLSLSSLLLQSRLSLARAFVLRKEEEKKRRKKTHPSPCTHTFVSVLAKRRRVSATASPRSSRSRFHTQHPHLRGSVQRSRAARERVPKRLTSNNGKQK